MQYSRDGGATWLVGTSTSSTSVNITGLDRNVTYTFRVRAVSASCPGDWSTLSSAVICPCGPTDGGGTATAAQSGCGYDGGTATAGYTGAPGECGTTDADPPPPVPVARFRCNDLGNCVDFDNVGTAITSAECASCKPTALTFNCENKKCNPVSDGTGTYKSYSDCINICNPPCAARTITAGNCSYAVPTLNGDEVTTINTSTKGFTGSATVKCVNGSVTVQTSTCVEDACTAPPYNFTAPAGCTFSYAQQIPAGATKDATLTNAAQYTGAATIKCAAGSVAWDVTSCAPRACDTPPYNYTAPAGCAFTYSNNLTSGTTVQGTLTNSAEFTGNATVSCDRGAVAWTLQSCAARSCNTLGNYSYSDPRGCVFTYAGTIDSGKTVTATLQNSTTHNGAASLTCTRGAIAINVTSCAAKTAPSTPLNCTAVEDFNGNVTLSWSAPTSTGGANITGYVVRGGPSTVNTGTTGTYLSGLTKGQQYTFKIAAVNSAGEGASCSTSIKTCGATGPDVAGVSADAVDATTVNVSWSAGSSNGFTNISYSVEYKRSPSADWIIAASTNTASALINLGASGTYTFRVMANGVCAGRTISGAPATVGPITVAGVPDAPSITSVTQNTCTGVTLTWSTPAENGAAITGYSLQYSNVTASDGTIVWTTTSKPNVNSTTLTGLTGLTTYKFRIAAVNQLGTGAYSNIQSLTLTVTPPTAPTGFTATPRSGGVTLQWGPPADSGCAAVANYLPSCWLNGVAKASIVLPASSRTASISGLVNGQTYDCYVAAKNSVNPNYGANATARVTIGTVSSPPSAPTNFTVTAGDGSLTLRWAAPAAMGSGTLDNYLPSCWLNGAPQASRTLTGLTTTFTGLINDETYNCYVAAKNTVNPTYGPNAEATGTPTAPAIIIDIQPAALTTVPVRTPVTLSVTARATTGAALTYTWQKSYIPFAWRPSPNPTPSWQTIATGSSRTVTVNAPATAGNFDEYRCSITTSGSAPLSALSDTAVVIADAGGGGGGPLNCVGGYIPPFSFHNNTPCAYTFPDVLNSGSSVIANNATPNYLGTFRLTCNNGSTAFTENTCGPTPPPAGCSGTQGATPTVNGDTETITNSSINVSGACLNGGTLTLSVTGGIAYSPTGQLALPNNINANAGQLEVYVGGILIDTVNTSNASITVPAGSAGAIGFRFKDAPGTYDNNRGSWLVSATFTYS